MTENRGSARDADSLTVRIDEIEEGMLESLRLGQDLRFLLVCVGGGAARIGQEIIGKHVRYLETVVINCDPRVQDLDEFDRRVHLGAGTESEGDTAGSPVVGGHLARAAEPALDRIFEGATFVTVVTTLGGGTGTGVLPFVLEAAARRAAVLSVFAVKPFACEGERRALADRALGRLHFLDAWVEKVQHQLATLTVLDNESLVPDASRYSMRRLNAHWADLIATHVENAFIVPAEAAFEAARLATLSEAEPISRPEPPAPAVPLPPLGPGLFDGTLPALRFDGGAFRGDAELTFEIQPPSARGPGLP
jgi:Tubulin/FtsZ family, GTPase domain